MVPGLADQGCRTPTRLKVIFTYVRLAVNAPDGFHKTFIFSTSAFEQLFSRTLQGWP